LPASLPVSYAVGSSRGDRYRCVVGGSAGRRHLPCIIGLVGDAGTLCSLSLLGDLHTGGEALGSCESRSALARSTRSWNPVTECRLTSPRYGVPLTPVSIPRGSAPVARSLCLCSLGPGSPRVAYRSRMIVVSRSLSRSLPSSNLSRDIYWFIPKSSLFRIVCLVFITHDFIVAHLYTHSLVHSFRPREEDNTPRWFTYLPVVVRGVDGVGSMGPLSDVGYRFGCRTVDVVTTQ